MAAFFYCAKTTKVVKTTFEMARILNRFSRRCNSQRIAGEKEDTSIACVSFEKRGSNSIFLLCLNKGNIAKVLSRFLLYRLDI